MPFLAIWAGLGMNQVADSWLELPGWQVCWLIPEPPLIGETRIMWARRMAAKIPDQTDVLGGFSMGGMLALEQAASRPHLKGILLCSYAASRQSWRTYVRAAASLGILHILLLLPSRVLVPLAVNTMRLFGRSTYQIMRRCFTQWGHAETKHILRCLLQFRPSIPVKPMLQIIGGNDPWLKSSEAFPDISGAGHFLLPKYRHEVSTLIRNWLKELP